MACHPEIPCSFAIWARFCLLKSLSVSAVIRSHSKVTHARPQRTHAMDEKVHDSSVSGPIRKTSLYPGQSGTTPCQDLRCPVTRETHRRVLDQKKRPSARVQGLRPLGGSARVGLSEPG